MEIDSIKIHISQKKPFPLIAKRAFDLLFSLVVLLLFAPLFIFIYLGIRLSSRGSALYSQERLGKKGKPFKCYKFRTMVLNAESKLHEILMQDPELRKEWDEKQKLQKDPRIFAFGKFLRKTSLDELPQFWNVLKGDLSVVGPRPYMVSQKKKLGISAYKILSMRPGITGIWQTSGRSQRTFKERIELDSKYVSERNFFLDLHLIAKTIPVIIFPKDAY